MLDFVLSKMTWLITSILVMSFIVGFYQIQVDTIDENMLQGATHEVERVIKRLDGINGEMNVNFTFDRYYSYRSFYLPGKVGGEIYKFSFYESYIRGTSLSGDIDIPLRFGTNIQPLQMGNQTNVELNELLENPQESYVSKLTVYSNQDFGVASRYVEGEGYKVFVFLFTDTVFYSASDDDGKQLLYGSSEAPKINNITATPDPQEIDNMMNITLDVKGDHISRVFHSIKDPNGEIATTTMIKGNDTEYYYETNCTMVGEYSYKVWARDVFGRIDFTEDWQTFDIIDTMPPFLYDVLINHNPQESGDRVIFYVSASDADAVESVYVNTTAPNGAKRHYSMTPTTGDRWTFSVELIATGEYFYDFSAVDPSGNWRVIVGYSFKIEDTIKPSIVSFGASPLSQIVNKSVYFNATVMDIVGVKSVTLQVSRQNIGMLRVSGDLWSIDRSFSKVGTYIYVIVALDDSGNTRTVSGTVNITDP